MNNKYPTKVIRKLYGLFHYDYNQHRGLKDGQLCNSIILPVIANNGYDAMNKILFTPSLFYKFVNIMLYNKDGIEYRGLKIRYNLWDVYLYIFETSFKIKPKNLPKKYLNRIIDVYLHTDLEEINILSMSSQTRGISFHLSDFKTVTSQVYILSCGSEVRQDPLVVVAKNGYKAMELIIKRLEFIDYINRVNIVYNKLIEDRFTGSDIENFEYRDEDDYFDFYGYMLPIENLTHIPLVECYNDEEERLEYLKNEHVFPTIEIQKNYTYIRNIKNIFFF